MAKKNKEKRKELNRSHLVIKATDIQRNVSELFENNPDKAFTVKQIFNKVGLRDKTSKREGLNFVLDLEQEGALEQLQNGTFRSKLEAPKIVKSEGIEGIVDHVNQRFAYIICDNQEDDIWVKSSDLLNAVNGDRVAITVKKGRRHGARPEGKVIKVIERAKTEFVGKIDIQQRFAFVIPDSRKLHFDIFVYPEKIKNAKHNDKVLVKIKDWHGGKLKNPVGVVTEVLGKAGEHEAEMHSIMAEFGLPFRFPKDIEAAAQAIEEGVSKDEIKKRKDLRDITTFTIDPEDAKDFDDAISVNTLKNGNYEIGVHIADVSHYLPKGGILDKEAVTRATSVYLVDRTIPMLPEKLSNGVCSLRPKEDKLTFGILFEITPEGIVKNHWIGRTIIHSDRRFTYEEAQERIESKSGEFFEEINLLNGLAHKFKAQRFKNGAINFETVEVKFKLDEAGKPLGIFPKERKDAHKLVEEFMLLANKYVAEFVYRKDKGKDTFVYRTHDDPNPEKLETFSKFAAKFGHRLKIGQAEISNSLNQLMTDVNGKPEQNVLESLAIRSMSKAVYTTDPKGHFGLAFQHYTHFTSPIRRYPDVMVHRLLQHYLDGGKSPKADEYNELCKHSSNREKVAADAERASIKYKQVEFMQMAENRPFEGIISGVTEWGIFVEMIETKCEGMIRSSTLTDDHYEFDEKNFRMIGKRNKRMFTLGDQVTVMVVDTDIDRRTIDLEFVDND
jgi:ribonuclease R